MKALFLRIVAAFTFFTRLPFWRLADVPRECYERVVPLWPLVGYLTGGGVALLLWLSSLVLPCPVAVVIAFLSRILLTGAIHEDGLADFCDGFGGGANRQRILEIMKDSHIGTFGVLGLLFYCLLQYNLVLGLVARGGSVGVLLLSLLCADVFCKWLASTIIYFLPYARKEAEAKSGLLYAPVPVRERVLSCAIACLPLLAAVVCGGSALSLLFSALLATLSAAMLFLFMRRKIQGYTGDCCGATFLICELMFYLGLNLFG